MTSLEARIQAAAGEEETRAGLALREKGGVHELESSMRRLRYRVADRPAREVTIYASGRCECSCQAGIPNGKKCSHMVAALCEARMSGLLEHFLRREEINTGSLLLDAAGAVLPKPGSLQVEFHLDLHFSPEELYPAARVGMRVGETRLYSVRSMVLFFDALSGNEPLPFSRAYTWDPSAASVAENARAAVLMIRSLVEARRTGKNAVTGENARWVSVPPPLLGDLLCALRGLEIRLTVDGGTSRTFRLETQELPVHFRAVKNPVGLSIEAEMPSDIIPVTRECRFIICDGKLFETGELQRRVLSEILPRMMDGFCTVAFPDAQVEQALSELIPVLQLCGTLDLPESLSAQLVREKLKTRVWLDRSGSDIAARVSFCYGNAEVNPFEPKPIKRDGQLILRDAAGEKLILELLDSAGFRVRQGEVFLTGNEQIYRFITDEVSVLEEHAEIWMSREFRRLTPRRAKMSGQMGIRSGHMVLQLTENGAVTEDILPIMQALDQRHRYFRLKDGTFLDLDSLEEWQELARAVSESVDAEGSKALKPDGSIMLRSYRAIWLSALIREKSLPVSQDEELLQLTEELTQRSEISTSTTLPLRPYQQRGLAWLKTLDRLRMGGVLADDMGLGKTIQMIALLRAVASPGQVSLVVTPTSLTYNWLSEINRFAPELCAVVLSGNAKSRSATLMHVYEHRDVDVVITSYPLLRRDLAEISEIRFRIAAFDEAQQIKNTFSQSAAAVRQIQAESRFALTGTPLENGIGELWSIYDSVLPGYLGPYVSFMRQYQDGSRSEELQRRIRPFMLRRLKGDVLTELPDKQEIVLTAQMTPEQEKVYSAALMRLRGQFSEQGREKLLTGSTVEVLAALTELRQICCHPALVLSDYTGSSGKLLLLLDILPGALTSGRRVLLFSQFTSMLKILRRQLENNGIRCMYLDGQTQADQRLAMCERFNAGDGDVFLISLKAGGTGLNLTGADLVIHYDPWWNPAAEDQATDRAHRIGQTHKVDVIRLCTHGTIEEQVIALGARKRALFDRLVTPGEKLITGLSEQELRELFQ